MMNKKRLSIVIDETCVNEEENQTMEINKESSSLNNNVTYESHLRHSRKAKFIETENRMTELNIPILNQILNFMEKENSFIDISYSWYTIILTF